MNYFADFQNANATQFDSFTLTITTKHLKNKRTGVIRKHPSATFTAAPDQILPTVEHILFVCGQCGFQLYLLHMSERGVAAAVTDKKLRQHNCIMHATINPFAKEGSRRLAQLQSSKI
ncbi:hypothetical protein N7527_005828 [Penicillium freii]|nr:hypothetical protein N7527_005828 [Penicillium freii]